MGAVPTPRKRIVRGASGAGGSNNSSFFASPINTTPAGADVRSGHGLNGGDLPGNTPVQFDSKLGLFPFDSTPRAPDYNNTDAGVTNGGLLYGYPQNDNDREQEGNVVELDVNALPTADGYTPVAAYNATAGSQSLTQNMVNNNTNGGYNSVRKKTSVVAPQPPQK